MTEPVVDAGALHRWLAANVEEIEIAGPGESDLQHEVMPLQSSEVPDPLRASLVLEQYHLSPQALGRLPEFQLQSRAGFQGYLSDHARSAPRPPPRDPS